MKGGDTEVEADEQASISRVPTPEKMLGKAGSGYSARREQGSRELLYPEMFQRCRNLERDDKGRVWRKV